MGNLFLSVVFLSVFLCGMNNGQQVMKTDCSVCESMPIPNITHVIMLFEDVFEKSGYTPDVFPIADQTAAITTTMKFSLYAITDFDEIAGELNLIGKLRMAWYDDFVIEKYAPKKHFLESLDVPQNDIWLPPITVFNSVGSLTPVGDSGYDVTITMTNGYVQWTIGVVTKTGCKVDSTYYPFDIQNCEVVFTPWGYTVSEIELESRETEVLLDDFTENEEWALTETEVHLSVAANRSLIHYKLTLARRPVFFLVNMIVPVVLLGVLNSLAFVLPTDSGERIGFATNIFLTFAVYMTILSQNLPQSSRTLSIMSYYTAVMLSVSSITTLIAIFTLNISCADPATEVPKSLAYFTAVITCRVCKRRFKEIAQTEQTLEKSMMQAYFEDDEDIPDPVILRYGVTWRVVGLTIDKFFFVFFGLGTIAVSAYHLTPLFSKLDTSIVR